MDRFKHITFIKDVTDDSAESATLALDMAVMAAAEKDGKTLLLESDLNMGGLALGTGLCGETQNRLPTAANVLLNQITLNQAITSFRGADIIFGNPYGENIAAVPAGHFNIFKDDFALLAMNYKNVLIKAGDFPDSLGALMFTKHIGQALIITSPFPAFIAKAYKLIADMPAHVKVWLAVTGTKSEDEGMRTFISLMRAGKENLKKDIGFAGTLTAAAALSYDKARDIAHQMGLLKL